MASEQSTRKNRFLDFSIQNDSMNLDFDMSIGTNRFLPYYRGETEITPKKEEQVLETKNKSMTSDVVVYAIPYAEVSNIAGGTTATIGIE